MDRRLPPHAKRTLQALWRAVERSEHDQRQGLLEEHARRVVGDTLGEEDERISNEEIDYQLNFSTITARSTTSTTGSASPLQRK